MRLEGTDDETLLFSASFHSWIAMASECVDITLWVYVTTVVYSA